MKNNTLQTERKCYNKDVGALPGTTWEAKLTTTH